MKKKNLKWFIEIDEKHCQILIEALDIYARVKMGQVERIEDLFWDRSLTPEQNEKIREQLDILKATVFPQFSRGSSFGIASPENPESSKIAYGIKKTIEHRVSWDRVGNPSNRDWKTMIGVNFDEPKNYSTHPLPKIMSARKSKLAKLLGEE